MRHPTAVKHLIDALPIGIALLDTSMHILALNKTLEGITGFSNEEAVGIPCRHIIRSTACTHHCPLRRQEHRENPQKYIGFSAHEGDIINRYRQRIAVRINITPLYDATGTLVAWIHAIEDISALRELEAQCRKGQSDALIGRSAVMEELFHAIQAVAQSDMPLLITGETGTGKDTVAEHIHKASARSREPFIKANLTSLPDQLVESELFGHCKHAFQGAQESKAGCFRMAHGGTLCLSEIADISLALQAKILRFLDEGTIWPVGETHALQCSVRLIVASSYDLEQLVKEQKLRPELYQRLIPMHIAIPALRNRGEDIEFLFHHYLGYFAKRLRKTIHGFSAKALRILLAYSFPGNVRELKNIIEYAVTICAEDIITPAQLPAYILHTRNNSNNPSYPNVLEHDNIVLPEASTPQEIDITLQTGMAEIERKLIIDALIRTGNRKGEAARLLGWGRSTLWRKLKAYGLE